MGEDERGGEDRRCELNPEVTTDSRMHDRRQPTCTHYDGGHSASKRCEPSGRYGRGMAWNPHEWGKWNEVSCGRQLTVRQLAEAQSAGPIVGWNDREDLQGDAGRRRETVGKKRTLCKIGCEVLAELRKMDARDGAGIRICVLG